MASGYIRGHVEWWSKSSSWISIVAFGCWIYTVVFSADSLSLRFSCEIVGIFSAKLYVAVGSLQSVWNLFCETLRSIRDTGFCASLRTVVGGFCVQFVAYATWVASLLSYSLQDVISELRSLDICVSTAFCVSLTLEYLPRTSANRHRLVKFEFYSFWPVHRRWSLWCFIVYVQFAVFPSSFCLFRICVLFLVSAFLCAFCAENPLGYRPII